MPQLTNSRIFFAALVVPAATAFLATYLRARPLSASKSRTIKVTDTLSKSLASSPSLKIVNPRDYQALEDTRSIFLVKQEVGHLSDEEILAKFMKGYFGGWIFTPELCLCRVLNIFGTMLLNVDFSDIDSSSSEFISIQELSLKTLPPKYTRLIRGGSFMVLDYHIKTSTPDQPSAGDSFVEIAFGDDRKTFSGVKRFEVSRSKVKGESDMGVIVTDSSLAGNPMIDGALFSWLPAPKNWMRTFHNFYALYLFQDGVREVLKFT